jgi:8-oxoguanine deaminase
VHDPVGALLLCSSGQADMTIVHGEVLVREGRLTRIEIEPLIERHNALARELVNAVS